MEKSITIRRPKLSPPKVMYANRIFLIFRPRSRSTDVSSRLYTQFSTLNPILRSKITNSFNQMPKIGFKVFIKIQKIDLTLGDGSYIHEFLGILRVS